MTEFKAGYKPKEDERIVQAHQLESMLCQHELLLRINGGWWYVSRAVPVKRNGRPAAISISICLLSSVRKRKLKAYTMDMPEGHELLVKIRTHR